MRRRTPTAGPPKASHQRIYATVDAIPLGMVAPYGAIASLAGLPGRARLVGRLLRTLPQNSPLSWHRVVNAAGEIARRGDPVGEGQQRARLCAEGVTFDRKGRVRLSEHYWPEARASADSANKRSR